MFTPALGDVMIRTGIQDLGHCVCHQGVSNLKEELIIHLAHFYMPGTVLGAKDTTANQRSTDSWEFCLCMFKCVWAWGEGYMLHTTWMPEKKTNPQWGERQVLRLLILKISITWTKLQTECSWGNFVYTGREVNTKSLNKHVKAATVENAKVFIFNSVFPLRITRKAIFFTMHVWNVFAGIS